MKSSTRQETSRRHETVSLLSVIEIDILTLAEKNVPISAIDRR